MVESSEKPSMNSLELYLKIHYGKYLSSEAVRVVIKTRRGFRTSLVSTNELGIPTGSQGASTVIAFNIKQISMIFR